MADEGAAAAGLFEVRAKDFEYLQEQARVVVYPTSENPLLWMLGKTDDMGDALDGEAVATGNTNEQNAGDGDENEGMQAGQDEGEADDLDGMGNDEFDADGVIEVDAQPNSTSKKSPSKPKTAASGSKKEPTDSKPKKDKPEGKKKTLEDNADAEEEEMMKSIILI